MKQYGQRRIFITEGKEHYQIFTFSQEKDGSIYCNWPDFSKTRWVTVEFTSNGPVTKIIDSPGDGKLTVHGTGMAGVRAYTGSYNDGIVIHGNHLTSPKDNKLGARHLFTAQINQPYHLPNSPVFNRESDYVLTSKKLEPVILIFFAIPIVKEISIGFNISGHVDDLIPEGSHEPSFLGFQIMELRQHMVFWIAYKSRHMETWPTVPHILFDNGYNVPLIFGQGNKEFRAEFRKPIYDLSGTVLTITL